MKLKKAYKILKRHNEWRRGSEKKMIDSVKLGIAIDTILKFVNTYKN
jgi:pantothenate kinase-related protein Tda10